MSYDTMNYTNALAGALKEAINEIEKLKEEINILKANSWNINTKKFEMRWLVCF